VIKQPESKNDAVIIRKAVLIEWVFMFFAFLLVGVNIGNS
jgi:hypothetical protein